VNWEPKGIPWGQPATRGPGGNKYNNSKLCLYVLTPMQTLTKFPTKLTWIIQRQRFSDVAFTVRHRITSRHSLRHRKKKVTNAQCLMTTEHRHYQCRSKSIYASLGGGIRIHITKPKRLCLLTVRCRNYRGRQSEKQESANG
jgi:hypothetical protein